jgi:hypothetical protein
MFCSSCGSEVFPESSFCPKCGKQISEINTSHATKRRSRWWFLLPILFHIIGGFIAYFIVKDDDPKLAKNCLYLGIILIAIQIAFVAAFWIPLTTMPYMGWEDSFISQV